MTDFELAFKPCVGQFGWHDPSAVLFEDGTPVFGVEEERYTRQKHAPNTFPVNSIEACLDHRNLDLADLSAIRLPYRPELKLKIAPHLLRYFLTRDSIPRRLYHLNEQLKDLLIAKFYPTAEVEQKLDEEFGRELPPLELLEHHACHAASAFHPSGFDSALVLTLDAQGEYDATVVWRGGRDGLSRVRTYEHPNSLGYFFGAITEFLGYHANNGEGKVMGLAPYGSYDEDIAAALKSKIDAGVDYDVTDLVGNGVVGGVESLEQLFGRPANRSTGEFTQWEKDLAYTAQTILEDIVSAITREYCADLGLSNVAVAGGVAMNCKLNKEIRELDCVDDIFVQPVAHDAGLALGAGMVDSSPQYVSDMSNVYLGPTYTNEDVEDLLRNAKVNYSRPDDLEADVAERLADGDLVGWFQGRMEMGPRALGNRSILADPRSVESRDRVNKFVKHREEWRPFAPSLLEEAAGEYLVDGRTAPYMIELFEVNPDHREDLEAVLHPADDTTRPQTVREDQNERYYTLIEEFERLTGVPVVLNTSFNDHAEPIVNRPSEALKDFFGMGLDVLVLNDYVVKKPNS